MKRRDNYQKEYQRKIRLKVQRHYGGNPPKCSCCEESILEFLGIDHIFGREADVKGSGSYQVYRNAIRRKFPAGLQVLCHNCNMAKGFYGECPHEGMRRLDNELRIAEENVNAHRRSANRKSPS